MIAGVKELVDAELAGKENRYTWRKLISPGTTAGHWFDLSVTSGMPVPQYYAATPLTATPMSFSEDRGMFHGYDAPEAKYLRMTTALCTSATPLPTTLMLLDYLMYYPFIDESTVDPQDMDNTNTLPRYTTGEGVQIMAVTQGARGGGQFFRVTYTNQDGVSGRQTPSMYMNSVSTNGTIVTSSTASAGNVTPFITLQDGDTGVRSIEQVTMLGADVGLFALVLVKPLATTVVREITAPVEKDYSLEAGIIPEVKNNAYLNWICLPSGNLSGAVFTGDLKVIWT